MMYAFQPRVPLDHVMELVKNIRSGERKFAENMMLVGAITGEIGSLLNNNFTSQVFDVLEVPATLDGCLLALESMLEPSVQADPNFDPTPWIPIILKLIELWLSRRS
ncbi:hypothetical protein SH449x_000742 [Pirellulaceae bacterium SH449]